MGLLSEIKQLFYEEDLKYKAGISQQVGFKIGRMLTFLGARAHLREMIPLDGPYSVVSAPQLGVGGLFIFEHDAEIFNVYLYIGEAGVSGTTELDLKRSTDGGATWNSIFATTPKAGTSTADFGFIGVGGTTTGMTAPILVGGGMYNVNAGDALRLDKLAHMTGGIDCGLIIHYRAR